jgi:hypothetical protein
VRTRNPAPIEQGIMITWRSPSSPGAIDEDVGVRFGSAFRRPPLMEVAGEAIQAEGATRWTACKHSAWQASW